MKPLSATDTRVISEPRAHTASSASPKGNTPAATNAPYCRGYGLMTMSGLIPYSAIKRVSDVDREQWPAA